MEKGKRKKKEKRKRGRGKGRGKGKGMGKRGKGEQQRRRERGWGREEALPQAGYAAGRWAAPGAGAAEHLPQEQPALFRSRLCCHRGFQQPISELATMGASAPACTTWPSRDSGGFCSEEANLCIFMNVIVYGERYKERTLILDARRTGAHKHRSPWGL